MTETKLVSRLAHVKSSADNKTVIVTLAFERGDTGYALNIRLENDLTADQVAARLRCAADDLDEGVQLAETEGGRDAKWYGDREDKQ